GKRKKKADDDEQQLPALAVGDERLCKRAQVTRDQTKPPKEYSDASILLDMEHAGRQIADEEIREQMKDCALGTPATRAAIIERLIDVGYVRRSGKNLVATEKGVHLIGKRCRRRSLRRRRRAAGTGALAEIAEAATAKRVSVRALRGWRRFWCRMRPARQT
ncbi:MAG: DNA topoisomerase, partial [Christensenellales bacterium]